MSIPLKIIILITLTGLGVHALDQPGDDLRTQTCVAANLQASGILQQVCEKMAGFVLPSIFFMGSRR